MKQILTEVTERIRERSAPTRQAYLQRIDKMASRSRGADRMGCANVAHAFAAMPANDKLKVVAEKAPNIGIVTAYNEMLSAHQPYVNYPDIIRHEATKHGATVQVAGGVPAMCDGITQGEPGMELSLFSRDTIAMGTAIALSHDVFDAVLLLGIYWRGMNRVGALMAMVSGLVVTLYYIAVNHPWLQMRFQLQAADTLWFGLDPVCAGVFGVPVGLLLGVAGSKLSNTLKN